MNSTDQNCITEEEAELYDRQIRLWGANVQRSLRNTKVLVIGMKGVAAEVCKNLILSGVKSVTMMDHEKVTKADLSSQYLLYPESVGENRATASLKAAQVLNPNVKVTSDSSFPLDKPISYFKNFDVVCATNQSSTVLICLNDICKLYKIKFFCGDSFGMFGYLFEDLIDGKSTSSKVPNLTSFQTALTHKWILDKSVKRRKQEDPSFLIFKILTEFKTLNERNPSRDSENDEKQLLSLRNSALEKFKVDEDVLPLEYLDNVYGEYGPTCSIIGGMIAQEVVKSLSKDDPTSTHIYLFNHIRCQMSGISLSDAFTTSLSGEHIATGINIEEVVEL